MICKEIENHIGLVSFPTFAAAKPLAVSENTEEPEVIPSGPVTPKTIRIVTAVLAGALAFLLLMAAIASTGSSEISRNDQGITIRVAETAPLTAQVKENGAEESSLAYSENDVGDVATVWAIRSNQSLRFIFGQAFPRS